MLLCSLCVSLYNCFLLLKDAGMEWIIHLDTDELIHPGGAKEYSLRRLLLDVPSNVDMVIFPNYVSCRKQHLHKIVG